MSQQSKDTDDSIALITVPGPAGRAIKGLVPFLQMGVLAVSVAAAIPTAQNLYYSWKHGIPFNQVSHKLTQYELWMKNLECKIEYRALSTASGGRVDVGACSKTGDIAIRVAGAGGEMHYEWIAFETLKKTSHAAAGFMDLLFPSAHADTRIEPQRAAAREPSLPDGAFRVAQAGLEVMCQKRSGDKIVRVIKDGGKCFRETVSPLRGSVDRREEVSCDSGC